MGEYGDCIVVRVGRGGRPGEHLRVERADPVILIADELIAEWMAGNAPVTMRLEEAGQFTFGTPGEGVGRVTYQVGERHDMHTHVARRIDAG